MDVFGTMLKIWPTIRRLAFWLTTCFFTITALAIGGQFFIAWADEEGWFAHPNARVHSVIAYLGLITATPWFGWAGCSVMGFAFGVWLDTLVRRREQSVSNLMIPEIDREALVRRAEDLSAKVMALVAQHQGRQRAAFIAGARNPNRDGSDAATAAGDLLERFSEKYLIEFHSIINQAKKIISLNRDEYWLVINRLRGSDLESLSKYLGMLAGEIRHPYPDLPMHSPMMEAHKLHSTNQPVALPPSPKPQQPPA